MTKAKETPTLDDVEASQLGPTDAQIKNITRLAQEQYKLAQRYEELCLELDKVNKALKVNREVSLPMAMDEAGVQEFTLKGGYKVAMGMSTKASITEEHKEAAHHWLEEHNMGTLIKRRIQILFGREDQSWAAKFLRDCEKRKKKLNLTTKEWVEPQTLMATVRRLREAASEQGKNPDDAIPVDLFGVYVVRAAEVIQPKEKATL